VFSELMRDSADGNYVDAFFSNPTTETGYHKRLRAVVQNNLLDFANEIQDRGHLRTIIDDPVEDTGRDTSPWRVSRADYVSEVSHLMKRTWSCELPGTFNP
jgi:hypothetical protein